MWQAGIFLQTAKAPAQITDQPAPLPALYAHSQPTPQYSELTASVWRHSPAAPNDAFSVAAGLSNVTRSQAAVEAKSYSDRGSDH